MHDLLTDHARTRPVPSEDNPDNREPDARDQALARLLGFYTAVVGAAHDHLRALSGDTLPEVFVDPQQALSWLEAEYDNLITAVHTAHTTGDTTTAIRLPAILGEYLNRSRRFEDAITVYTRAQETAHRTGDTHREAGAWNNLGSALREVRRFDEAIDAHSRARQTFHQVGDAHSEAQAWNNLGLALARTGRRQKAHEAFGRAVQGFGDTHDAHSLATALKNWSELQQRRPWWQFWRR
ncbi:tetratricopeptide repeat protein [Nocardiopsis aegyptia]|uniref:tetratricopeptide repeat protein n=1 Tax=Nocardiopsis aegyptia TaxID=220378 RepID=UPI00367010D7